MTTAIASIEHGPIVSACPSGHTIDDATILARCKERYRDMLLERQTLMTAYDAEPNRSAVDAEYAARLGKSTSTLNRLYYAWLERGIQALVPAHAIRKPATDGGATLPPEFIEWFRGQHESINTESIPAARRIMLTKIRRGDQIPGYGTWRAMWAAKFPNIPPPRGQGAEYPRSDIETILPRGLSARNLHRHKSELFDRTAARQGTWAASKYGPMVYTTRVGTKPGQVLIFDDVWHNQNVNYMGSTKALRPIELCCLDLNSGHKVAWGARPRLYNPETKRHETIKEHEFLFLLAYVLTEAVGYRKEGTVISLERGTAALDESMDAVISGLSNNAITIHRAPLKNARQLCGIYRAVGSGNPRSKTHLESHHSISHTALSHLPGQIGRSAGVRPEEIYGRDKANQLLVKIGALLPPELAAKIEMPYLHWDEYMACVDHAYTELAWRTWHTLEGWESLRYYTREFCLPGYTDYCPMDSLQDMPPDAAAAIQDILAQHPEWCRIRPLAPIEAWNRHRHELVLLPKCATPLILGPKNGIILPCPQTAELKFTSRQLGPDPHIYSREYTDDAGARRRLAAGQKYLYHINPFSRARELYISTPEGEYLGVSARLNVPCHVDADGVHEQIKRKTAEWSRIARRVSGRHLTTQANQALAVQRNSQIVGAALDQGIIQESKNTSQNNAQTQPVDEDFDSAILELAGQ